MAFIVAKRPVAAIPIKLSVYDQDGSPMQIEFVAKYHRHTAQQVADLQNSISNRVLKIRGDELITRPDGSAVPEWSYETDLDFLRDKMADWSDVDGPDGSSMPYSKEALEQMLADYPELTVPLFRGFFEAHQGVREKNS